MTTTVSTQDQLAASRMLSAKLHQALTLARFALGPVDADPDNPSRVFISNELRAEVDAALEHNEPEIHALRTDAERAAREARRLAEARTHGARVQSVLVRVVGELEGVPLTAAGQDAVADAMKVLAQSGDAVQKLDRLVAAALAVDAAWNVERESKLDESAVQVAVDELAAAAKEI